MKEELELRIKMDVNYIKVALQILALSNDRIEVIVNNLPEDGELAIDLNGFSNSKSTQMIASEEMLQVKLLLSSLVAAQVAMNLDRKSVV